MKLRKNFLEIERYFIVDLSSIEENAINRTFRGLVAGEQEVGVFYCSWYSRQALQPNLGSYGKGYELMLQAMYKFTRMGCEQLVEEAIQKLPLEQNKKYVRRNWRGTRRRGRCGAGKTPLCCFR